MSNDTPLEVHPAFVKSSKKLSRLDCDLEKTRESIERVRATATERIKAFSDLVWRELDQVMEKLEAQKQTISDRLLDTANKELPNYKPALPCPVGTMMVKWYYSEATTPRYQRNGVVGVIEVITAESLHPKKGRWMPSHTRAQLGEVVIRVLSRDGKNKQRKYVRATHPWLVENGAVPSFMGWRPLGVDPNLEGAEVPIP